MIAIAAMLVAATRIAMAAAGIRLIVNLTPSEPRGIYRVHVRDSYPRGTLVVFPVPTGFEDLVTSRGWLAPGVLLIKGVGAVPGDRVCVSEAAVSVNGMAYGPVYSRDSAERPLPVIRGCRLVEVGEFWPLSRYADNSFDGRYMGAASLRSIVGEAVPVWTF